MEETSTTTSTRTVHLTSGRLLARNTGWNIVGQLLPMAVGVVAIPPLVRLLGVDRFGLLSLAWIVVGYLSLFDLGMGRALTKLVADKLGSNEEHAIPPLVWTSLMLLFLVGAAGGVLVFFLSPWMIHSALQVPAKLQPEALSSFRLMATSIPLVTVTSGLRGILEAQQRFGILNVIRIPTSIFSFVGPLFVLPFSRSLVSVIAVLIVGRLIGCAAHFIACLKFTPALRHHFVLQRAVLIPVIQFGGWMTVSNIISPFMISLDRFFVGALLSVGAVAYYTAPFDLVLRLTFVPAAVTGVLFPAFAVSLIQASERTALLYSRGVKYTFLAMFPIILITVTFAPEGLKFWLGTEFAHNSTPVLRWLAIGVFVTSLAHLPFALIQSAGRPDITAKLHMFQLPFYLFAVWVLTKSLGIEGTAIAWTGRITLESALLFLFAGRMVTPKRSFVTKLASTTTLGILLLCAGIYFKGLGMKIAFTAIVLTLFALVTWFLAIAPDERSLVLRLCESKRLKFQT